VVLKCTKHDLPWVVATHGTYGLQVEICVQEFVWRGNNNRKPKNFRDILYYLKVIFFATCFEALKSVFSYSKTTRRKYAKIHFISASQIKELEERFLMV
jgi:hypothetical protein